MDKIADAMSVLREWLRAGIINLLLDLLCWVVPYGKRFELIIEPGGDDTMIAILRERGRGRNE